MKLYSHVALIAAMAVPAFCQEPAATAKMAAQARAMADQAAQVAESVQAQVLSSDKMMALQEKLAAQADKFRDMDFLSADKMAEIHEKMAQASEKFRLADKAFVLHDSDLADEIRMKVADKFDSVKMADIEEKVAAATEKAFALRDSDMNFDFKFDFDSSKLADLTDMARKFSSDFHSDFNMAFLQAPQAPPAPPSPRARIISLGKGEGEYDRGTQALDERHYDEAVLHFDQIINSKSSRADGALYWKAYALNRAGKRDDALAAIATLRRDYATSAWLNDAQALETEIKQNSGQAVSPNQESNDDLKLLAINSLMSADSERAIPLIEGILKGNSPPKVKKNAMFVLTQSKSPRAQQVLSDYAKGGGNPDLQLQAIRYLGQSGAQNVPQQLGGIYGTVNDTRIKQTIINSLSDSRAYDALLNIARTEKDANLRNSAIRAIAGSRNAPIDGLLELYPSADSSAKSAILDGLRSRRDAKTMVDLARKETDPQVKRRIVERLGEMHENKDAMDYMMELLK